MQDNTSNRIESFATIPGSRLTAAWGSEGKQHAMYVVITTYLSHMILRSLPWQRLLLARCMNHLFRVITLKLGKETVCNLAKLRQVFVAWAPFHLNCKIS